MYNLDEFPYIGDSCKEPVSKTAVVTSATVTEGQETWPHFNPAGDGMWVAARRYVFVGQYFFICCGYWLQQAGLKPG
jgi:hypothetical protein